jgi:ribonuclease P protein component
LVGGLLLRPAQKLRSPAVFRRVFRRGVRLDGPLFLMIALVNEGPRDRLGLVASRKLGGAVARNRAKRLLRESFRRHPRRLTPTLDLVLVPKREIAEKSGDEVAREYRERLRRLSERHLPGGSRARAGD